MEIVILGAGAVGLGLASALAGGERRLRLVVRDPETRHALARHGLSRAGLFGEVEIPPDAIEVEADSGSLAERPPDFLLVCTKAFASRAVAEALAPRAAALASSTRLVLCQNGWGNEQPFLESWPPERIFHARVITGFRRREPHRVEVTAHAAPIALGSLFGEDPALLEPLARALADGGLPAETRGDIRAVLWAKMLYNCALNPLGALTRRRYGALAEDPETRAVMARVVAEVFAVLDATRERVDWPDAESYLETFYAELIPPTAAHESSMLQDLRAGRRTEIEALCGAVERLGEGAGVETPTVSALATLVRAAEPHGAPGGEV